MPVRFPPHTVCFWELLHRSWSGSKTRCRLVITSWIDEIDLVMSEWVPIQSTIQVRFTYEEQSLNIIGKKLTCRALVFEKGEWSHSLCRTFYSSRPPDTSIARKTFDEICRRHSPVFRFFFLERFGHSMQAWHSARMKYTRSVAVNSIVGHILGIGDRHVSNILVHQVTGECVHIDFGIVFEQAKLLPTPERVPFRLTRNIVDGFGPSGTEGCFSRAAEQTSKVLKENSGSLLTVLSAVVADPLYTWSMSPVKAKRRQAGKYDEDGKSVSPVDGNENEQSVHLYTTFSDEEHNKEAKAAIAKVQEKLQGYEDGTSGEQQSVEGQVQLLINSARDPANLCHMYMGWAPWI